MAAKYEFRLKLPESLYEYVGVFSKSKGTTLPPCCPCNHKIELEDRETPPFRFIYSSPEVEQLPMRQFPDKNLANNFICPSQSPTGMPTLFIPKKGGWLRLAVDDRGLNHIIRKNFYPLPLILDRLYSTHVYIKNDLRGAYNLV